MKSIFSLVIFWSFTINPAADAGIFDGIFGGGRRGGWFGGGRNSFESVPYSARPKPEAEPVVTFDEREMFLADDWKVKYFDVVIVVNKDPGGQYAKVYRHGKLELTAKVSTGRETPEYSQADRERWGLPYAGHMPSGSYFSQTRAGYFTPDRLGIDHVSGRWTHAPTNRWFEEEAPGIPMPYSVFFYNGVATHQGGEPQKLGRRASGGCVRMTKTDAQKVFWMVRMTGGPLTPAEMGSAKFMNEYKQFQTVYGEPYAQAPEIPVFDKDTGMIQTDPTTGEVVKQQAVARTLVIVENSQPTPVAAADGPWLGDADFGGRTDFDGGANDSLLIEQPAQPEPRRPVQRPAPTCRSATGFPVPCP